ncbi:MAG: glycosyltransferase family 4 protein [Desulfuromonadales bacterium]|nr:glycosyltransferase family 4 protein [Desulfuromonadales bacterium]
MKILFLVPRLDKASTRYRVLQFLPHLEKCGVECKVISLSKVGLNRYLFYYHIIHADVVFVQKKLFTSAEIRVIRSLAKYIVYDFDDAVMYKEDAADDRRAARQQSRFAANLSHVDLVLAGNNYLADSARRYNSNVHVLPTCLDTERYTMHPRKDSKQNAVTLGWIGSRGTLRYLKGIAPILDEVGQKRPETRLKIIADDFFDLEHMPVVKTVWSSETEISEIHSFDIGLMPLTDDPWTRGKCGFKLLQCMAVGLPVVTSPVGANREIVTNGSDGYWAEDHSAWVEKLLDLIDDAERREQMGQRARQKIEEYYSLEFAVSRLMDLLRGKGAA